MIAADIAHYMFETPWAILIPVGITLIVAAVMVAIGLRDSAD